MIACVAQPTSDENPVFLANCIDIGEKGGAENTQEVLEIIMSAVFGNVVLHEDENLAMQMIKSLAELQLANSDDPRRLIRKGTYGFRLMFLQLFDCFFLMPRRIDLSILQVYLQ
jgi:hypothetical protein